MTRSVRQWARVRLPHWIAEHLPWRVVLFASLRVATFAMQKTEDVNTSALEAAHMWHKENRGGTG